MKLSRRDTLGLLGAGFGFAAVSGGAIPAARAQEAAGPVLHEIKMLNKSSSDPKEIMVFEPDLVRAMPGDRIKFLATDKSHSASTMKDLIPEGAEPFRSAINEELEYEFTVDGAYAIQCTPHMAMGMVMLVLVGDVSGNYDAVKEARQRGKAKDRFEDIFARADALLAAEAATG
jgi:pseudoazurin